MATFARAQEGRPPLAKAFAPILFDRVRPLGGAVAGMMIAPVVFLEPNMMLTVLLYGFAGAVVGGLTSPGGAVIGGFMMGVLENLAGEYVIGSELKLTFALVVIVAVLLFKPSGLFGRTVVQRV